MKQHVLNLKSDIKDLSVEQQSLKNQRKTVNRVGDKTMEPWQAQMKHQRNRYELRHMFVAYAILRNKKTSVINELKECGVSDTYVGDILSRYVEKMQTAA